MEGAYGAAQSDVQARQLSSVHSKLLALSALTVPAVTTLPVT